MSCNFVDESNATSGLVWRGQFGSDQGNCSRAGETRHCEAHAGSAIKGRNAVWELKERGRARLPISVLAPLLDD